MDRPLKSWSLGRHAQSPSGEFPSGQNESLGPRYFAADRGHEVRTEGVLAPGRSRTEKRDLSGLTIPSDLMDTATERYLATLAKDSSVTQRRGGHGAICFIDGVIEALLVTEAISVAEATKWNAMLLSAARGHSSPSVASSSGPSSESVPTGDAIEVIGERNAVQDVPQFLELIPIEGASAIFSGVGSVQILGIERYDSKAAIVWRVVLTPAPAKPESLSRFAQILTAPEPRSMKLTDDVGTRYMIMGGNSGGRIERVGRFEFRPAPPDSATRLFVSWEDAEFDIVLPRAGHSGPLL